MSGQQLLADHLAAAFDADAAGLHEVLAAARRAGDTEVEVLTLDALANVLADEDLVPGSELPG